MAAFCFLSCGESSNFAIAVQTTYHVERFRSATSHGRSKKFFVPNRAERKDRSKVTLTSCFHLLKALAERV